MWLRSAIGIGVFPLAIWLIFSEGWTPWPMLLMLVGTLVMLRPIIWNMMQVRSLHKLPGYGQEVCYTITPEALHIDGESKSARLDSHQIVECVPTTQGILIYHSKTSYTWLPHSAFDSTTDYHQAGTWLSQMAQ
ncbi:YcxB family protein [Verrucomicrobiaceae bacterium N1E253]|uniref:YcxB family protein n=1 Tax=Oceaniferula marina TaxID=2748318 RepID=A0A851GPX0_9BACT|nr:YcxB family protein [Oceaniferula marina]NWK57165.1 YcxB family protein [Oceaniferula marina]